MLKAAIGEVGKIKRDKGIGQNRKEAEEPEHGFRNRGCPVCEHQIKLRKYRPYCKYRDTGG